MWRRRYRWPWTDRIVVRGALAVKLGLLFLQIFCGLGGFELSLEGQRLGVVGGDAEDRLDPAAGLGEVALLHVGLGDLVRQVGEVALVAAVDVLRRHLDGGGELFDGA